ncbi:MAG: glycoside hydrolase family 88 protein [Lachnospiraceae bacterium]|nr:glycoside hydrolase family 88 protein [Lachnospiraceae bacterium]
MERLTTPLELAQAAVETIMRKYDAADLPPKGHFHYHQGVFLSGVYKNYLLNGEESWYQYIKSWVDAMLDEEGNILNYGGLHLDDIMPGNLLFPIYERTKNAKYKKALDELMQNMLIYPKNKEGGFWHMKQFANQMWLDGIYMGGPFVVKYASMFHCPEYYDISVTQALLMQEKTRDEKTGLWYHAYDCERKAEWADPVTGCAPEFWGRSIGWVPVAILEELDYIPESHARYKDLCKLVKDLLCALCNYQSEDGRWYQVVNKCDQPGNWLENSCSCLYTAALCKAVRKGILEEAFLKNAEMGYKGVVNSLTWEGQDIQIGNVCIGTGVGDYAFYCARPTSTNDLHGVGAFLLMCAEMQKVMVSDRSIQESNRC